MIVGFIVPYDYMDFDSFEAQRIGAIAFGQYKYPINKKLNADPDELSYLAVIVSQKTLFQDTQNISLNIAAVEQTIIKSLSDKGFNLTILSALEAEKFRQANLKSMIGDNTGKAIEMAGYLPQVIVSGQVTVYDNGPCPYNQRYHSYGASLNFIAYEPSSSRPLASVSAKVKPHINYVMETQKAIEKASLQIASRISKQIIRAWLDACYNDHNVLLIVEKIPFRALASLKIIMDNIKGLARVNQKSFIRERAELMVGWQNCNISRLAEMLEGLSVGSGIINILEVQGNMIRGIYTDFKNK
ncbi:hypothetical protein GMMP15_1510038 [Candidatus Magnetomoraceae bacterium gMMP-15]